MMTISYSRNFSYQRKLKESRLSHSKTTQLLYRPCLALQANVNQDGFISSVALHPFPLADKLPQYFCGD